jgi:hypothetical protein
MVEGTTKVHENKGSGKADKLVKPHIGSVHVDKTGGQEQKCYCRARNCRGFMFK